MSGISSASLVDLKAELFRKQEEFKKQKLLNASTNYIKGKTIEKKQTIFSKKNAGVVARAQKDLVAKTEEEDLHEKSRKTLEAKSKLYEKITHDSSIPDEDGSQRFLVDFQKKAIDKLQEERNNEKKEENDYIEDEFVDSPSNPDEKWVEYTDSLGRTRTCMKKDLEKMQRRDKEMGILPASQKKEDNDNMKESSVDSSKSSCGLNSQEIYCQMLKEKWEKEEEDAQAKPVGPVHYENVRFDEIRTHGVGYFQFSKDETERQEQMHLLNSLRNQTKDEREKRNQLKEKRDSLMAARLKKIKDRQRAKMGLPPEPETKDESYSEPKIEESISKEVKTENVAKNPAPVREWDLGKDKFWEMEKKYFKERREERHSEFAPPSSYFTSNSASNSKRKQEQQQYSSTAEKKPFLQKFKKDKMKSEKNEIIKEVKKTETVQTAADLAAIPLPDEKEKLTNNNSDAKYQQLQTNESSKTIAAASDSIVSSQMWGQPVAMTTQYNPMYIAALSNQHQNICPGNVVTVIAPQASGQITTQQTVALEKPKPTIVDRRFVKNVESLESL